MSINLGLIEVTPRSLCPPPAPQRRPRSPPPPGAGPRPRAHQRRRGAGAASQPPGAPHLVLSTLDSKGQKRTTMLFTGRSTTLILVAIFSLPLYYNSQQPPRGGGQWAGGLSAARPPGKCSPRGAETAPPPGIPTSLI